MTGAERYRNEVTRQLLERSAAAWAANCVHTGERLAAAAWALMGDDDFIDGEEASAPPEAGMTS